MATIGERLTREHPETNKGRELRVYTLKDGMMDLGLKPILSMWQASAAFVLLIACANVASLLLARGAERQREMAVRLALGASRARVVRELLIESTILAVAAVPGALAVAWLSLRLIVGYMPAKIAGSSPAGRHGCRRPARRVHLRARRGTALVFGMIPAIQAIAAAAGGHAQGRRPQRHRRRRAPAAAPRAGHRRDGARAASPRRRRH